MPDSTEPPPFWLREDLEIRRRAEAIQAVMTILRPLDPNSRSRVFTEIRSYFCLYCGDEHRECCC